ncbi:hypothetical protein A7D17_04595 [Xanthomonas floridensis]|uniref:Uncharacterized protein n=1 Tax=Xanthomonas floridensis TaxID=1843580 RepID=A0A1A9M9F5_9XANT|nr:hypothetical protein A7D17_04595 [Xanthomonas floridensis]
MFERLERNHTDRAGTFIGQVLRQEHRILQRLVRTTRRCSMRWCRTISHAHVIDQVLYALGIDADHTDVVDTFSDPVGDQSC